jgi:hypothetical protein
MRRRTTGRRVAAALALAALIWTAAVAGAAAFDDFPRGLLFLGCGLLAAGGSWEAVLRRGWGRVAAICLAVAALAGGLLVLADDGFLRLLLLLGLGVLVWNVAARTAFDTHVALPAGAGELIVRRGAPAAGGCPGPAACCCGAERSDRPAPATRSGWPAR